VPSPNPIDDEDMAPDCIGPCNGLSANAMWAPYCPTCPLNKE
jgi:hypothetical protein